ncbi:MAG: dUTP diphosphatase, partial [Muribaculaceae bacterium]|nr:dUTP diphosphatase [Muribaculaceae bacterium]
MKNISVRIVNKSHHPLPAYSTQDSAGMDVRAYLPEGSITLHPMQRCLIPTGLHIELPSGYE